MAADSGGLLDSLNPAQREAVVHQGGPLLILAGAGSGKTRVITVKIAWLIQEMGVDPASILAVTFTNKAAREMRERAAALEPLAAEVMIRTFHSFGAWLMRRHARLANLDPHFSIYDDDDALQLLATLYPARPKTLLAGYASRIARAKDLGIRPQDAGNFDKEHHDFAEVYQAYETRLREIGNLDFGDLISRPVELLRAEPAVRNRLCQRFRVVLIDEYQDTNQAQFALLKELYAPETALTVVGDDDQSIYRFRGAEVRNILNFSAEFPGTSIVRLEDNYRSSQQILSLASAVVAHNEQRLGKTMVARRPPGPLPRLWLFGEQDAELRAIIATLRAEPMETAILYRTNAQSRAFEAALLRAAIPYRIVGTLRFYEREEIKDSLSLLRLIANPRDEIAFRRMVNKPARGIGATSLDQVIAHLASAGGDTLKALDYAIPRLGKKAAQAAASFARLVEGWRKILEDSAGTHLGDCTLRVLEESGLLQFHQGQDQISGTQKAENLEELLNAAALYPASMEGLANFLEATELDAQAHGDEDQTAQVTLITMHNTKGLEFDRVIVSGLEEGIFPRQDEYGDDLEEQRRLLYVALTRAREQLIMTHTQRRQVFGRWTDYQPSRFVAEMPDECLVVESDASYQVAPVWSRGSGWAQQGDEWSGYGSGDHRSAGADDFDAESPWNPGDRVCHPDYGKGSILSAARKGRTITVIVNFDDGRRMKLIPEFTPLTRLEFP